MMASRLRLASLPSNLRASVLLQASPLLRGAALQVTARRGFATTPPPFFTRARAPSRTFWSSRILFAAPVAGGLLLWLYPRPEALLPEVLDSPTLIPCTVHPTIITHQISSPAEKSLVARITALIQERIWEPILTARRFLHLLLLFLPVIVSSPMLLIGVPEEKYQGERWGAVWWYGLLVAQMQRAGPTFIKLAQWAASRADLFPSLLCERLGALHSNGKPHSLKHTKLVIERVFRKRFEDVFEEFDETPIGSGAIAQVYKATLRSDLIPPSYLDPKRPPPSTPVKISPALVPQPPPSVPTASVAVKILHPRVRELISRDLSIMSFFARCLNVLPGMQWLSLPEEVDVFGSMMHEQLDLRHEGENLDRFENNFAKRRAAVTFPRPLKMWSTHDVLVEEFQNALPLDAFLRNGGGPYDHIIANLGLDAFLNMLILDNFCHSDLHPGNIMIKFYKPSTRFVLKNIMSSIFNTTPPEDSSDEVDSDEIVSRLRPLLRSPGAWRRELTSLHEQGYQPELVFLDAGLVTTLDAHNRRNFLELFRAVAEFDGYRAGKLMVERCRTPELAIDTETFALKMQHLVLSVKSKTFSLARIKISDILHDVLKSVRQHHVKMEGDFINTVLSILLLEGIGRQLDPNMDLFKSALPILRQLGRQMTPKDAIADLPKGDFGAMLKFWVWIEARELVSSAIVNLDELVRYDWLMPNI